MKENIDYTAVIRTLGFAGEYYQILLNSLVAQTIKPKEIIVYIAEGYPIPKETVGVERYIYVKKGMVAQRALCYDEVETEYMLFLDDDLEFPPNTVEKMFQLLLENNADVISPDIFPNAQRSWKSELMMTLSGRMRARRYDQKWGYKIMRTGGYSYNKYPNNDVYLSQTNAGACFLCKKKDFLSINFQEELWLDMMPYPIGEDQVMYFKMYCNGFKQLTWYNHQFVHLDAGSNMTFEKEQKRLFGDIFFKIVFWYRFIRANSKNIIDCIWNYICIIYYICFQILVSVIKGEKRILKTKITAIRQAIESIKNIYHEE